MAKGLISPAKKPEQVVLIGGTLLQAWPSQDEETGWGRGEDSRGLGLLASDLTQLWVQVTKVRKQKR